MLGIEYYPQFVASGETSVSIRLMKSIHWFLSTCILIPLTLEQTALANISYFQWHAHVLHGRLGLYHIFKFSYSDTSKTQHFYKPLIFASVFKIMFIYPKKECQGLKQYHHWVCIQINMHNNKFCIHFKVIPLEILCFLEFFQTVHNWEP